MKAIGYSKYVFRNLALISQIGISVLTPVLLCTYIGYRIDEHFHTSTIIWLLILGVISGCNMAYRLIRGIRKREEAELEKDRLKMLKEAEAHKKTVNRPKVKSRVFRENPDE